MRAAICANPDDAAAFERMLSGDKSAINDMSTPALKMLQEVGPGV